MHSTGLCVQLACIWEATARKPGNVHRYRDFEDLTYLDFLVSAAAIAPVLDCAHNRPIGQTILDAIEATRRFVRTNTNLGIVLLLAPLAAVPAGKNLKAELVTVLESMNFDDARHVYRAIRLAQPGGMGRVAEQDISREPDVLLQDAMALSAERDLIARQYTNGFQEVFQDGVPALRQALAQGLGLESAIIYCHLALMALHPDSLIARKCGLAEAEESRRKARCVLQEGWPRRREGSLAITELDAWLCADGNTHNPGTTADLVTACLFILLRDGTIQAPPQYPWLAGSDHG
jgi:triphosphoribosyl-dephospho-CoA synthase